MSFHGAPSQPGTCQGLEYYNHECPTVSCKATRSLKKGYNNAASIIELVLTQAIFILCNILSVKRDGGWLRYCCTWATDIKTLCSIYGFIFNPLWTCMKTLTINTLRMYHVSLYYTRRGKSIETDLHPQHASWWRSVPLFRASCYELTTPRKRPLQEYN